jgi:hypothetical protein
MSWLHQLLTTSQATAGFQMRFDSSLFCTFIAQQSKHNAKGDSQQKTVRNYINVRSGRMYRGIISTRWFPRNGMNIRGQRGGINDY